MNLRNRPICGLIAALLCALAGAQQTPKAQSQTQLKRKPDLISRWSQMACAVVQISDGSSAGTGVFISSTGDLLTAAHVVLDRSFSADATGNLVTTVTFTESRIIQ
jgi:hypothetical protein